MASLRFADGQSRPTEFLDWLVLDSRVVDVRIVYTEGIPWPKACQESNIAGQYQALDR